MRFTEVKSFFGSLGQSCMSRAGTSFEKHVDFLFNRLGYPFEKQVVINGKPDFLMPSEEVYRSNPTDVILFTAKRTLRERWKQIIIEGVRTPYYFLGTIDPRVSEGQINEMAQNRVIMVVPERIIAEVPVYQAQPNVISYRDFFAKYVEPTSRRWES